MISNESYIFLAVFAALALVVLIYLLSPKVSTLVEDITKRGAEFRKRMHELLERHAYPDDPKAVMMVAYVAYALHFHQAIWLLKDAGLYAAAFALVRPVYDAWLRALWINAVAKPDEVEKARHDKLQFPKIDKMLAEVRSAYFGHASADPEFAEAVDKFFYWMTSRDPKTGGRKTSLWEALHSYTHPGARSLGRLFTDPEVKQNYSEWDIAQGLNLPTLALILLMRGFFMAMDKQPEADEVETLALQYFAEFNGRLNKGQ